MGDIEDIILKLVEDSTRATFQDMFGLYLTG